MRVLITGSSGFIGKNLKVRLEELKSFEVLEFTRDHSIERLKDLIHDVDAVVHLAGENRPEDKCQFDLVNAGLTETVCNIIQSTGKHIPFIFSSSVQAELDNPYGVSKYKAEQLIKKLHEDTGNPAAIYRLPGVFGKWCRPNYNSVVATFCYNLANEKPIQINVNHTSKLPLVYIDDLITSFISILQNIPQGLCWPNIEPQYSITLSELAAQIHAFENSRTKLLSETVGVGLTRALYATYISYLPASRFIYDLKKHSDERGSFVEMLKTKNSGQFSYFTAHPGVTRGGHYHQTKTEKFLVIFGTARFNFRNISTGQTYELVCSGEKPQIVETAPGWTHEVTNIGENLMVAMLWASEIFDSNNADTVACEVLNEKN
jgi:UDP-2-acetamido-2,6-beta-L-arabino-hexul-4-ose reductase